MEEYLFLEKINQKIKKQDLLDLINVKENDIIYAGGSLIESQVNPISHRIGNVYSDLDLFIIREHDAYSETDCTYTLDTKRVFFHECNEMVYDVEVFDRQAIEEISRAISNIEIEAKKRIFNTIKLPSGWDIEETNEFLTRFTYGIPLYHEAEFYKIQRSFMLSKFFELLKYKHLQGIDNTLADIRGNMIQGEMETALLLCRSAATMLMDFLLASAGIMNDRSKWGWIKTETLAQKNPAYHEIYCVLKRILFRDLSKSMEKEMKLFLSIMEETIVNIQIEVDL